LINAYDVYQHVMDYWANTMQDDCYLIAADGWKAETTRVLVKNAKGKEVDKGWTCELIPKPLIVARYFAAKQQAMDTLQGELDTLAAQMTELEEEHGGDEGAFAELDKVNKAHVTARLKEIKTDKDAKEERAALTAWLDLCNAEADAKKALKDADAELDALAYAKYAKLTEADIKTLVVDDKWLSAIGVAVHGEMDRISQALTQRVNELADRYATPLPQLASEVETLSAGVATHLKKMGFVWN
jgi:type I restriction enzyme M protein